LSLVPPVSQNRRRAPPPLPPPSSQHPPPLRHPPPPPPPLPRKQTGQTANQPTSTTHRHSTKLASRLEPHSTAHLRPALPPRGGGSESLRTGRQHKPNRGRAVGPRDVSGVGEHLRGRRGDSVDRFAGAVCAVGVVYGWADSQKEERDD